LDSFVSVCQRSASKRKRGDDVAYYMSGNEASVISNVQISLKERFSNTSKVPKAMYNQKEFDEYVGNC
jgi:hypothetical protein